MNKGVDLGDYYPGSGKFFLGFLGSFGIPTDDLEQAGTTRRVKKLKVLRPEQLKSTLSNIQN